MGVKTSQLSHGLLNKFPLAERLRLLEVGRWETEERRVINTVRVLELQVIVDQGKQLVRYFPIADFVLNNRLEVFEFNISFGHWI